MNRRVLAVVAAAGVLPWVVVTWPAGWYPLFSLGFAQLDPFAFTSLPEYLGRVGTLPTHLRSWPIAVLLWACAAVAGALDVDRRVTAGLLAFAGGSVLSLAAALSGQRGVTAFPVGAVVLWLAAVAVYALPPRDANPETREGD